jgi:hypothetical protein
MSELLEVVILAQPESQYLYFASSPHHCEGGHWIQDNRLSIHP